MSDNCFGCHGPLVSGKVVTALGQRWHKDCFKCYECRHLITAAVFTESDGYPLCSDCAEKKGGITGTRSCCICHNIITDAESVTHPVSDLPAHAACVKCAGCREVIRSDVVTQGQDLFHPACAKQGLGKPCAVCFSALSGKVYTVDGDSFHELCFEARQK